MLKVKDVKFFRMEMAYRHLHEEFVQDMLRYDRCFQSDTDPNLIAFPVFKTKEGDMGSTEPTLARWASFGIKLTQETKGFGFRENWTNMPWTTYRHPDVEGHATNYGILEKVSLDKIRESK